MARIRHGYDVKKELNYLTLTLWIPDTFDNAPLVKLIGNFIQLIVKAYNLEKYNKRSKYDKI